MTIVKSKSGRRVKHTNNGKFGKKSKSGFNLGLMHIWVLAFDNKYYLRVCYDPQFIATERLRNLRLFLNFCGNPLCPTQDKRINKPTLSLKNNF